METQKGYKLMEEADKIVAISESIYQKYALILKNDKLTVIRNGINPERYFINSNFPH